MSAQIRHPEIFGVTRNSLTLCFDVEDASGPVDAPASVRLNGETRATAEGGRGTRHLRIEGLEPDTEYRIEIDVRGADPVAPERYFPGTARTLPATPAREVASFATLNDLHFGEPRFGGALDENMEFGEASPESPAVLETDSDVPYWQFMNEDAVSQINAADVDMTIIKGDIADRGREEQFLAAAQTFAGFERPHHAFLGNHDYYGLLDGEEVDGYGLLGQEPAPRGLDLGGWRLLLLDTVEPGHHHGVFPDARFAWLSEQLAESRELRKPTLLLTHHQPVPPAHANSYPNSIGIVPEHSLRMFELIGQNPQVRGVLIGHTHRNRVRVYGASGAVPFIEVNCTKDYPGGFAHYRLFDDGSFRQEVRRTATERALAHSSKCRSFFKGGYRHFALGTLESRSFIVPAPGA